MTAAHLLPVPGQTDWLTLVIILGMTVITVVSRSLFFLSSRPLHLPLWFRRGLRLAPVAALAAVLGPEILLTHGHFTVWNDARIFGALAGGAWYLHRHSVMGTIVAGMAVYLPLHLALGW